MRIRLPISSRRCRTDEIAPGYHRRFRHRTSIIGSSIFYPRLRYAIPLLGWFVASVCFGQINDRLPANVELPNADLSLLRVLGALLLVIGLFFLGIWCFKRWQRLAVYRGRVPQLNIVEVKPLGHRAALYVVAYEHERLLLASSPAGIQMLTRLPPAAATDLLEPVPTFGQALDQALAPAKAGQG